MTSTPETSEEQKEFTNPYKPLIYILPKNSLESNSSNSQPQENNEDTNEGIITPALPEGNLLSRAAVLAGTAVLATVLPGGLFVAPIVNAAIQNVSKNPSQQTEDNNGEQELTTDKNEITQLLEKTDLSDWVDFVDLISFASIPDELDFPPGHPLPNRFYRVHPLKKKNNRYIPIEIFDSILYKERESELIKILVDLGAKEILIEELIDKKNLGSAQGEVGLVGTGGANVEGKIANERSNSATQITKLNPKNWKPENFKSDEYSWLSYEPEWESLVHARLKGGCLSSSVHLSSDTSFSISAQFGLTEGLLSNFGSLGGGSEFSRLMKQEKKYEVTFIDF